MSVRWSDEVSMTHDETMMDGEFAILQLAGIEVVFRIFWITKFQKQARNCRMWQD